MWRVCCAVAVVCSGCGGAMPSGGVLLADAPRESELPDPIVRRDQLRPELFRDASGRLAVPACDMPLEYSLGRVDPGFELGRKQALAAIAKAVGYWETGAGQRLFLNNPDSAFVIDFVYDERQEMLVKRTAGRDPIADVRKRYDALEAEHVAMLAEHDERLRAYDAEVARWNSEGGAPPADKQRLDAEKVSINALAAATNALKSRVFALALDINSRGGPPPDNNYEIVAGFTDRTVAGDVVTALHIDIYMFQSWENLSLIIAHELGHSLGMDHVPSRGSLMFGGPNPQRQHEPSPDDLAELRRVCPQ